MQIFEGNITHSALDYLKSNLKEDICFKEANNLLFNSFGIVDFFETEEELKNLIIAISESQNIVSEPDRTEYGDFQTNLNLANNVAKILANKSSLPQIIIEPTCGKGNFILASLQQFQNAEKIYGIEIYKPYVWECKFNIIDFYLQNSKENKPVISIIHSSVFDYNFKQLAKENRDKEILIIGNPPWVTNSQLGSLNSSNLPKKRNFKNHNGLDAITGKGNFDIAEFITINLIETFQKMKGQIALLVKNSVIKNIVYEQENNKFGISEIERYYIDCKKEFNVSVEASLFTCKLNTEPEFECEELNLYNSKNTDRTKARSKRRFEERKRFGWIKRKFVSNIDAYFSNQQIDGVCPFEWRQGIKHDCSSIMELDKVNGHFVNGLKDEIKLENDLVYGLLKSSDLKNTVISESRKFTIVTQKKVGQETNYIKYDYPKTYEYLTEHQEVFNGRKSSIYNNKPPFSIFGVGDYSFKPYKVAISGLYKTFHFTLVLPQNEKPLMLDDTCYLLGFDNLEFAVYTFLLLNSETNVQFLQSITFSDAKRTFTKDVLMRIDLLKLAENIENSVLQTGLNEINETYNFNLTLNLWEDFIEEMQPIKSGQMQLF
ncbi:hypothetical protein [Chryseobacterium sp. RR2-3-20]|uniref:hypothetical protein n=1 Tax=Chryseobacterium sp. RR2-3-20 TaxID=2787626 RepID=UPI001ADF2F56|nr:hypothetical protein [Chryseobacterium sp. RR2-3-20]